MLTMTSASEEPYILELSLVFWTVLVVLGLGVLEVTPEAEKTSCQS